jgi:hypothetical protein
MARIAGAPTSGFPAESRQVGVVSIQSGLFFIKL